MPHTSPEALPLLSARVAALVGMYHGGSVNAAAADTGVPQSTLARIVAGETPNPRVGALQRLADFYHVDLEWLLTGEGEGPNERHSVELLRWSALLDSLGVVGAPTDQLRVVPGATWNAAAMFDEDGPRVSKEQRQRLVAAKEQAYRLELTAWTTLVREYAQVYGREAMRKVLLGLEEPIMLGFNPIALGLLADRAQLEVYLTDIRPTFHRTRQ